MEFQRVEHIAYRSVFVKSISFYITKYINTLINQFVKNFYENNFPPSILFLIQVIYIV